jgi:hypothetical protein
VTGLLQRLTGAARRAREEAELQGAGRSRTSRAEGSRAPQAQESHRRPRQVADVGPEHRAVASTRARVLGGRPQVPPVEGGTWAP